MAVTLHIMAMMSCAMSRADGVFNSKCAPYPIFSVSFIRRRGTLREDLIFRTSKANLLVKMECDPLGSLGASAESTNEIRYSQAMQNYAALIISARVCRREEQRPSPRHCRNANKISILFNAFCETNFNLVSKQERALQKKNGHNAGHTLLSLA